MKKIICLSLGVSLLPLYQTPVVAGRNDEDPNYQPEKKALLAKTPRNSRAHKKRALENPTEIEPDPKKHAPYPQAEPPQQVQPPAVLPPAIAQKEEADNNNNNNKAEENNNLNIPQAGTKKNPRSAYEDAAEEATKYKSYLIIKYYEKDFINTLITSRYGKIGKKFKILLKGQAPDFPKLFEDLYNKWKEVSGNGALTRFKNTLTKKRSNSTENSCMSDEYFKSSLLFLLIFKKYTDEDVPIIMETFEKCYKMIDALMQSNDKRSFEKNKLERDVRNCLFDALFERGTFRPDFLKASGIGKDILEYKKYPPFEGEGEGEGIEQQAAALPYPIQNANPQQQAPFPLQQNVVPVPLQNSGVQQFALPSFVILPGKVLPNDTPERLTIADKILKDIVPQNVYFVPPVYCGWGGSHYLSGFLRNMYKSGHKFTQNYMKQMLENVGDPGSDPKDQWTFNPENLRDADESESKLYDEILSLIQSHQNLTATQKNVAKNAILKFKTFHVNNTAICTELIQAARTRNFSDVFHAVNRGDIIIHPGNGDASLDQRAHIIYNTLASTYSAVKEDPILLKKFLEEAFSATIPCLEAQARKIEEWRDSHAKEAIAVSKLTIEGNIYKRAQVLHETMKKESDLGKKQAQAYEEREQAENELKSIQNGDIKFETDEARRKQVRFLTTLISSLDENIKTFVFKNEEWLEKTGKYKEIYSSLINSLLNKEAKDGKITQDAINHVWQNILSWPL